MAKTAMESPMIAMLIKSMGIDPSALIKQATDIGAAFQTLMKGQADLLAQQAAQTDMLWSIQVAMGIAPPHAIEGDMALLIADESRKFMGRTIMGDTDPQQSAAVAVAYQQLEDLLKLREGIRLDVYPDTRDRATVGIGHLVLDADNLDVGDSITQDQCDAFFRKDAMGAMDAAQRQMAEAGISSANFLPWLASVNFQLGTNWTHEFAQTWHMITGGNYVGAANHLSSTAWADETPLRVHDFAQALKALPPKVVVSETRSSRDA